MKKYLLFIILIQCFSLFAGKYAGDFAMIGSGVRASGMGGAAVAVVNDGSATYWNSAGLSNIRNTEITLMRAFLYENLAAYDFVSFCQPLPSNVTVGLSWTRLTIDDIPEFSEEHLVGNVDYRTLYAQLSGIPDSKFSSTDDLVVFTFSKLIKAKLDLGWLFFDLPIDTNIGGSVKYISRKIGEIPGNGIGMDLGFIVKTELDVLFDIDWLGDFSLGANFQNINGTTITWDTSSDHKDEIPFTVKIGYGIYQDLPWKGFSLKYAWDIDYGYSSSEHHYGLEVSYNSYGAVRMGYYDKNWSAGLSFNVLDFTVDYAFIQNGNIGKNTNRVGLIYHF